MKNLLPPILIMLLIACSTSGSKETALQDSTSLNDTLDVPAIPDEEPIEETKDVEPGDTSQLEVRFDEAVGLIYERHDLFHTVTIVSKQYEAVTDITWYFDADLLPVYYKETWAAEGNEGSSEFFIENGDVQCARIEEINAVEKWCRSTGGTKATWNEETGEDATLELLSNDYDNTCDEELRRNLRVLRTLLDVGEIKEEDENSYTIHLEKTVDVGFMFTETSDISIPKVVYNSVKGQ